MSIQTLTERLLQGDRRALARLLTYVEDGAEDVVREAVAALHPLAGNAHLVGVTGSPGVGKSTICSQLVGTWRRQGRSVAVLAVDPSSPFTGGALLGDRVRMREHALDPGVFVRSMASRGHLGGLSWAAPQALTVLDAAGFDVVLLETVGVGQAEVEVASVTDTTVVALAPGMGDAIQAAKAGILEIADVFCVNKADRDGADRTVRELEDMQRLGGGDRRPVPILRTVAAQGLGIAELNDAIDAHLAELERGGQRASRRADRARMLVREIALAIVQRRFTSGGADDLATLGDEVAAGRLDPYAAAERLVAGVEGQGVRANRPTSARPTAP